MFKWRTECSQIADVEIQRNKPYHTSCEKEVQGEKKEAQDTSIPEHGIFVYLDNSVIKNCFTYLMRNKLTSDMHITEI